MFNNYKELFHGYVDFYTATFFSGPAGGQSGLALETAPVFKAAQRDFCISSVSAPEQDMQTNDSARQLLSAAPFGCAGEQPVDFQTSQTSGPNGPADLLLEDPRLLIEEGGARVLRLGSFNSMEASDFICMGTIFFVMLLAKRLLSRKLSELKQIDQLGLRQKDRERLDESLWRLLYYTFSSSWLIYSCLKHNAHHLLMAPTESHTLPYDFQLHWSTYAILMIEAAFYLHATYALIFEDVWRRDSPMMLVHHLAAVFATLCLYATRIHQLGLISTVLRDTCDVLLEVVKLTKCFHIQHGRRIKSLGRAVNCFLTVFAAAFAINQLYYYPLFCLYHGLNIAKVYGIQTFVMVGIMTCALIFLLLDFLWFALILRLLYYMALAKPMKDLREYDDEDEDIIESDDSETLEPQNGRASQQKRKQH